MSVLLTINQAAELTGLTKKALKRRIERDTLKAFKNANGIYEIALEELDRVGLKTSALGDNRIEIETAGAIPSSEIDELIKDRGLDPADWQVERVRVSEWDSGGRKLEALKSTFIRKNPIGMILPARVDGYKFQKPKPLAHSKNTKLVVCVGDQQAPFYDRSLHTAFLDFLVKNKPDEGVLIGDTLDLSDISRHRVNPERGATVQECINSAYKCLRDYREASPNTVWKKLPGNHDERIRNIVIDRLGDLYGISRAQVADQTEPSVLSVEHLLRLDELGIEFVDPNGQYDQAQVNISDKIAARHGWLAQKGSGITALKSLEALGYSIVVGHSHRQSIVHKTLHDISGSTRIIVGIETGCMCEVGLGYGVAEDWQQGFSTITVHDDTDFHASLATFKNGVLYWNSERY